MISQRQQTTHGEVRTEVCQMLNVVAVVEARSWPPRETQRLRTWALASLTSGSSAASSSLAPAAFSTVAAKILGAPNGQYMAVTGVGGRLKLLWSSAAAHSGGDRTRLSADVRVRTLG